MARLRFLKPLTAYLVTRDARRDLDLDVSVIDRVRHAMDYRDGVVLTCIGKDGIESVGYHVGEPNLLAQSLKVLHGQYSAAHNARHDERAPWAHDRYRDTALHTDEVLLDQLYELIFRPDARVLVLGKFVFNGHTYLLRRQLEFLGVDAGLLDAFIADVEQTWAALQETPGNLGRVRREPRGSMPVAELIARVAYQEEKAAAIARYVAAAEAWRRGDGNAVVPPEMFAPHVMASGDVEREILPLVTARA